MLRGGLPFSLRLEPRLETERWLSPALTAGALLVALVISALILAIVGADPIRGYVHILGSCLGSVGAISDTLVKCEVSCDRMKRSAPGGQRRWSTSSMRTSQRPPCARASSQLASAATNDPACSGPVGDGANRPQ